MNEQWKAVVGYEGSYEVSDVGAVRSVDRRIGNGPGHTRLRKGSVLRPHVDMPQGHLYVDLYRNARRRRFSVHRLVLLTFIGKPPNGTGACHKDGNPSNNTVNNLYWGTRSQNLLDSVRHGSHYWAKRTDCKNGHEFTNDNVTVRKDGSRVCITCSRISARDAWRRKHWGKTA